MWEGWVPPAHQVTTNILKVYLLVPHFIPLQSTMSTLQLLPFETILIQSSYELCPSTCIAQSCIPPPSKHHPSTTCYTCIITPTYPHMHPHTHIPIPASPRTLSHPHALPPRIGITTPTPPCTYRHAPIATPPPPHPHRHAPTTTPTPPRPHCHTQGAHPAYMRHNMPGSCASANNAHACREGGEGWMHGAKGVWRGEANVTQRSSGRVG